MVDLRFFWDMLIFYKVSYFRGKGLFTGVWDTNLRRKTDRGFWGGGWYVHDLGRSLSTHFKFI